MRWRIVVVSKPPLSIEGRYAMTDTNVLHLSQPGTFADPLTEVLRNGARALLAQAVEAEVATFLSRHADELSNDGRRRLVRHGHLPEREIMTGIGLLRWTAAGMMEAAKGFRRLKAYKHLPALKAALAAHQLKHTTTNTLEESLEAA